MNNLLNIKISKKTLSIIIVFTIVYLFSINQLFSQNKLELEINNDKNTFLYFSNNSTDTLNLLKITDGSYHCWAQPCIKYKARVKINKEWVYLPSVKIGRCGMFDFFWDEKEVYNVPPNDTIQLSRYNIIPDAAWFGIVDSATIEVAVIYHLDKLFYNDTITASKLNKMEISPLIATSNFIKVKYDNVLSESLKDHTYEKCIDYFVSEANTTPLFGNGISVVIEAPNNPTDAIKKGLEKMRFEQGDFDKVNILQHKDVNIQNTSYQSILFSFGTQEKFIALYTPNKLISKNLDDGKHYFRVYDLNLFEFYN